MNKVIVVSSNCLTGGIAATVRFLLGDHKIVAVPLPAGKWAERSLARQLKSASAWFSLGAFHLAEGQKLKLIKIPNIHFDAFHPDIVYARNASNNKLVTPNYNSTIAIWCYRNRIDPADAARLFNDTTYRRLGYYARWHNAVEFLKYNCLNAGMTKQEFDRFFLAIKRKSVFMHSVNHPTVPVIVELAKILVSKYDPQAEIFSRTVDIPDGLTSTIWPIYPEIGIELGIAGDYVWRFDNTELVGPRAFVDFVYARYAESNIDPSQLVAIAPASNIDDVLSSQL